MCGLCGLFQFDGSLADWNLVSEMTAQLSHRGPDGDGFFQDKEVALGHRRLSIIDIDGGSQPISNEDGSLQLVFNGEIYNFIELRKELEAAGHVFHTRSDTEVIVHGYEQWGDDCLQRFNGIFAFALWDSRRRRLVLARDHLGVKPLYYFHNHRTLVFASEIKAILRSKEYSPKVNLHGLAQLFTLRFVHSPATLFQGIQKVPPGHLLVVSAAGAQLKRYWNWKPAPKRKSNLTSLVDEYLELFEDSVRLQMRSDVPVGLYLSSGIDSSALLAVMQRHTAGPTYTFTIGFEGGEASNETADARRFAEGMGASHSELVIGPKDYEKYFERYLWDLEEPVGHESAAAFYFLSKLAREKVKVVLCGQGVDEPWAGYQRYVGVKISKAYSNLPGFLTKTIIPKLAGRLFRSERLIRGAYSLGEADVLSRFLKIYSFYDSGMKSKLFTPWLQAEIGTDEKQARESLAPLFGDVADLDPLSQMLYIDTRASLPDDLLMVADKTSMANSVEARVPYLDFRIIEFIESLAPQMKLRGLRGKYLHKKALERWVPKEVVQRPKKGFDNPMDKWLRGAMRPYLRECLLSERAALHRYFNRDYLRYLVEQHEKGERNLLRHLHLMVSFELWHQKFIPS